MPSASTGTGIILAPAFRQGTGGSEVAGVFHPCFVAGFDEDARYEIERLLGAGHDDDLAGGTVDAS